MHLSMSQDADTYTTRDLPIASALKASGANVVRVDRDPQGRGHFVFADKEKCGQIVLEYLNRELTLDAKALFDAQRDLKTMLNVTGGQ